MNIDNFFRIETDEHNYILQEKKHKKKTGEEYWINISYHGRLEQALNKYYEINMKRKVIPHTKINEVISHSNRIMERIEEACKGVKA